MNDAEYACSPCTAVGPGELRMSTKGTIVRLTFASASGLPFSSVCANCQIGHNPPQAHAYNDPSEVFSMLLHERIELFQDIVTFLFSLFAELLHQGSTVTLKPSPLSYSTT